MGRKREEPLREGKVVKVIGEGDSKVIFMDSYITDDPEKFLNTTMKWFCDTILAANGSDMRTEWVRINPGRKHWYKILDGEEENDKAVAGNIAES